MHQKRPKQEPRILIGPQRPKCWKFFRERMENWDSPRQKESQIDEGESRALRLRRDGGEDTQPVLGRATGQQNCWATICPAGFSSSPASHQTGMAHGIAKCSTRPSEKRRCHTGVVRAGAAGLLAQLHNTSHKCVTRDTFGFMAFVFLFTSTHFFFLNSVFLEKCSDDWHTDGSEAQLKY